MKSNWLASVGMAALGVVTAGVLAAALHGSRPVVGAGSTPGYTPPPATRTVVGVGDSITYNANSWYRLAIEGGHVPGLASLADLGKPGATSQVAASEIPAALALHPNMITIGVGTNDLLSAIDPATTVANIQAMVAKAQAVHVGVILVDDPPNDQRPEAVGPMNDAIKAYAASAHLPLLDIYTPVAAPDGSYLHGMSVDGTHPNDAGSARITASAVKFLTAYAAH